VVRIDIQISEDLKGRMDAVGDAVDWSSVAQSAFEDQLDRLLSDAVPADIRQKIAGLLEPDDRSAGSGGEAGYRAGRDWALGIADDHELERLSRFEWQNHAIPLPMGISAAILATEADFEAAEQFWLEQLGTGFPGEAMLRGFVEGALCVWTERKQTP